MKNAKNNISVITALLFIFALSTVMLLRIGMDSDMLYPFSFAKDILTGVSIKQWYAPGPTFVPDLLFSIPLVRIFDNPVTWGIAFAYLQFLAIILLCTYFSETKKTLPFSSRFVYSTYVFIAALIVMRILFGATWGGMIGNFFLPAFHTSTVIMALLFFFWTKPCDFHNATYSKIFLLSLFSFIGGFSDAFYGYFIFFLMLPYVMINRTALLKMPRWWIAMITSGCTTLIGALICMHMNPGFQSELSGHQSTATINVVSNMTTFASIATWRGTFLTLFFPLVLLLIIRPKKTSNITTLLIASSLIVISEIILGLQKQPNAALTLRYASICAIITLYTFLEIAPIRLAKIVNHIFFSVFVLVASIFLIHRSLHDTKKLQSTTYRYYTQSMLPCDEAQKLIPGSVIIATIIPAKDMFELTNRTASLIAINSNLSVITPRNFIYNGAWKNIVKNPKGALFSTFHVNADLVSKIKALPNAQTLCSGSLVYVPMSAELISLAPILK